MADPWRVQGDPRFPGGSSGLALPDPTKMVSQIPGGDILSPARADLSPLKDVTQRSLDTQERLANERATFGGQYQPRHQQDVYNQQSQGINMVRDAALGLVPSAAEIQLREQAARNSARGFGVASALQGRSPGGALRGALLSQADIQATTNVQAAAQRAKEQEAARSLYISGLSGMQADQQRLLQLDQMMKLGLLNGEIGSLDAGARAAAGYADASAKDAAGQNVFKGGMIQTGVQAFQKSDRTAKTDIEPADLQKLADSIKGFEFKYKNPADGEGQRVGVMAQDVKKGGPIGKSIVSRGPDKHLRLDVGNAVGAALAMSAEALRRADRRAA